MNLSFYKSIIFFGLCTLYFVLNTLFATTNVNTNLGVRPPTADIIFTPPYNTGFFTSGNVYAEVTGIGIVAPVYMLTDNGTYNFSYRRGTGPYTTGAAFSPSNTRSHFSLIRTISRIDKTPPTFSGATSGNTYNTDITIMFTDNNSGATATLNGTAFVNGTTIIANGTYTLIITDAAGNTTGVTFMIDKTITNTITYNPPYASGFFTSGNVIATITGFNKTGIVIDNNSGSFTYTFTENGAFTFLYHDSVGNTGSITANVSRIDKIRPTFSGASTGAFYDHNISIYFTDMNLSGAMLNGTPYTSGALISGDGIYTFIVSDLAGNSTGITFTIDQSPPSYSGVIPGGIYSGNVTITFSDLHLSGATIDGVLYISGSIITGEGIHTFEVTDKAGNASSATFTIDKTPPSYSGVIADNTYNTDLTITFTDNRPGVTATLNGLNFTNGTTITTNGTYTLIVTDAAGNTSSVIFTIDKVITATIEYMPSSQTITSGNVIATITGFNKTGITITNNSGNAAYIFTGNDSFVFTYQDAIGNTGSTTATVHRIDNIPPQYFGFTSGATHTSDITITFTDNRSGATATLNSNPFSNGSIVSTNGTYILIIIDTVGNTVTTTFTLNKSTPPSGGGGGGGGGGTVTDPCIERTCNNSYYDALCGVCPVSETGSTIPIPSDLVPEAPLKEPIITPEETKEYSKEMLDAYKYAYALGITTKGTADRADLNGPLIRKQLAKMISEYAIKVVGLMPNNNTKCDFSDISNESEEMKYYTRLSCKLGLMGLKADGKTVRPTFLPNEIVTRAQFGTVFSRLIFGMKYNLNEEELSLFEQVMSKIKSTTQQIAGFFGIRYTADIKISRYSKHLSALKENNIMKKIDPIMTELRGYVMMMMMRADKNGVIQAHAGEKIGTQ